MFIHYPSLMPEAAAVAKLQTAPADKRERLLAAALLLFERRGFDGVAVPEIARAAGVATGTVYRYFATKEALVNALYLRWKTAYNATVLAPLDAQASPREMFATYWQRMTDFAQSHPRAMRFLDLHFHGSYLDAQSLAAHTAYRVAAAEFVRAARKAGAIRALSPELVAALIWGASVGMTKFAHEGALAFDARTSATMEEMLWRAIANDQPVSRGGAHERRTKR
ncbi:MAG TPA: TetR/AcrR family transcriptional regulator [Rhizomicrobium sp.]|nr:TetR/AcrR family transcriptional regulator [Rhizomicrobium sp.]